MPIHARQRGIDRQTCFRSEADFEFYLWLLNELAPAFACEIHSYVLMPNHVHLLLTAQEAESASLLMKNLGQRHAHRFNKIYRRCGPLWDGRFRSSLVHTERYFLTCSAYIELNPVRAGIVSTPAEYRWSSFRANALGVPSLFLKPHLAYLGLAQEEIARRRTYLELLTAGLTDEEVRVIRKAIGANAALGPDSFIREVEEATGRPATPLSRGRPRGEKKEPVPGLMF